MNYFAFEVLVLPACHGVLIGTIVSSLFLTLVESAGYLIDRIMALPRLSEVGLHDASAQLADRFEPRAPHWRSRSTGATRAGFRFDLQQDTPHRCLLP